MSYNSKFNDDGILLLKNILSSKEKKIFINSFYRVLSKYIEIKIKKSNLNFSNNSIHKKLFKLRKENPKKFSDLYLELSHNASIRSVFYSQKFINIFSKILNTKKELIFINGFMFRLDAPRDKRNTLTWHSDGPYYEQTYPFYNAGVCWLALTDNSFRNGTVKFIPGSNGNKLDRKKLFWKRKSILSSGIIEVPVTKQEEKLSKDVDADFGDVAFFHKEQTQILV